jgi:NAD(P)-dependent dehydrogenase (short-subunit alcohol dehydrogenase family)
MNQPAFDLSGKTVVVTGASSGMGASIAAAVGAAGANVVAVGRDRHRLESTLAAVRQHGGEVMGVEVDLTSEDAPAEIVDRALGMGTSLDGIVHTAGVVLPGPFEETSVADLERQWATNLVAPFRITQYALPHLRRSQGSVVFVSSVAGTVGVAGVAAYSATKGAVTQLSRSLAVELAAEGVRVNCIAPGAFLTSMNDEILNDPEQFEHHKNSNPARRWAHPDETGAAAVFLLGSGASFVHGAVLAVDGGYVAQ